MQTRTPTRTAMQPRWTPLALGLALACLTTTTAHAQEPAATEIDTVELDAVEVLGSRIRKAELLDQSPILSIRRDDIERTGLTSIGEVLQRLTSGGKALNAQFNTSGNAGAPPAGGGIGAGSSQVDLRHLESKRVLVLVDGKRWVNESSGSGVGGSVDLNTIPLAIVERIDVLGDGASAIYGSDAIAGVVNVITRRDVRGAQVLASYGEFEQGDGENPRVEMTLGGGGDRFSGVLSASYQEQQRVASGDRDISAEFAAGPTRGSPVTPQGRFLFIPTFATPPGLCPPTIDVNGDGTADVPLCDITTPAGTPVAGNGSPAFPAGFVRYSNDQAFNAAPFNLVLTPSKRKSLFGSARYELTPDTSWYAKALYNTRESVNQAAPNTIVIGPEAPGNGLADRIGVSRLNPFNPFGVALVPVGTAPGANMVAVARRPIEAGPRIFEQTVDTYYFGTGLEGTFGLGERNFFWDVNYSNSENRAQQSFRNTFNLRRMQLALGDPSVCAAIPGCVPLNLFGGQGAEGAGTLTPQMLQWIRADVHDASRQELEVLSANLSGDLVDFPAGPLSFATGVESRSYEGSFTPDQARVAGEIPDLAGTIPTRGEYDVHEAYAEFNVPLLRDVAFAKSLDLSVAARYSDYSTFGDVTTGKFGLRWRPREDLLLRGTWSEGFRAPFIGELFGLSQFGASIKDPCSGFATSGNAQLIANCQALGVPTSYTQLGFQVFTTTGGNAELQPESSDSLTLGLVYSPDWAQDSAFANALDVELTYYRHEIDDAIQAPNAQDVLDRCVQSGAADSAACTGIVRSASGSIAAFDNRLANIGRIETDGVDLVVDWSLTTGIGRFAAAWQTTYVDDYIATDAFGNTFSRTVGVEVNDSSIPEWQSNLRLDWSLRDWSLGWTVRYIDSLTERCSDAFDNDPQQSLTALGLCSDPNPADPSLSRDKLGATTYHDLYAGLDKPFGRDGLKLSLGLNNAFDKDPRVCHSCALNGYDPGTYDVPGRYWYVQAAYRFQ